MADEMTKYLILLINAFKLRVLGDCFIKALLDLISYRQLSPFVISISPYRPWQHQRYF